MKLPRLIIPILACLLLATLAYFWATALMDSLYAFRSPLHDNPPSAGEPLGEPLTRRVVLVLIDALRADTAADANVMPFLDELRQQGASATMHSRPPSFSAARLLGADDRRLARSLRRPRAQPRLPRHPRLDAGQPLHCRACRIP